MAVGEERHASTWTRFVVGGEEQAGLRSFEFDDDSLITKITDFWPDPYEPLSGREHLVERY